ncbi:MAG: hypothetical protein AB1656_10580 [Candidatus Omnitrophota bacterium]
MKMDKLRKRLDKNRPMTTVSIRFPIDVIEDLKRAAPLLGFSGYQPLIRAYVGQGLREDLERLGDDAVHSLIENLKKRGVSEELLQAALFEAAQE